MGKNIQILLILLIILNFTQSSKTYADLKVISYSPLHLNLTFSQIVPLPKFQLLFNQIVINYTVRNPSVPSSYYIIDFSTKQLINLAQQNLQKYILIFTFPLTIANGTLHLDSFMLQATRQPLLQINYLKQSNQNMYYYYYQTNNSILNSMAIAVVSIVYFLAFTTMIGMHSYNFLAIYIYISLYSPMFTALDYRCAYYLLFQLNQTKKTALGQFFYLLIPYVFIFIAFLLAFISRVTLKKLATRSGVCKQIYYYFSYRLAIIIWQIMCIPIVANISSILLKKVKFQPPYQQLSYMYVYFSIISLLFFSYMAYFTVNPQIGQSYQKWSQYIKTSHFEHFYGFHLDIDVKNWKKRNFTFIVSVFRLCIVIFVTFQFINVPNLLLQIFYLIYLFTLRPFKLNFFNYFIIGIQIFVIFFYLYRYLVQLYIGISDQIITSTNITKILLTNIICLCIIVFTYVVLGIYQFYQRMRATCYKWNREVREKLKQLQLESNFTAKKDHIQQQSKQSSKVSIKLSSKVLQKSSTNRNFQPSPTLSTPKSKSPSPKSNKKKAIIDNKNTETSKDYSIKNQSPYRQKSARKAKQKSSLLQTISLGQQTS